MAKLNFTIATPERVVLEEEIDQVTIPTVAGEITVLPNHVPLVGIVKAGVLAIKQDDNNEVLAVAGGFFEVSDNQVKILADTAERAEELDLAKVEEAHERASAALAAARNQSDVDYTALAAALERELARVKVARKHRTHHGSVIDTGNQTV
jgi:F-type H+-transporting ATPase subunit epsilon